MTGFQRARQPDQIHQRRAQLLAAAAELFDAEGPHGAGLNAIAARAGFTKSNVYRYFESREQVLLELFQEEFTSLTDALEQAITDSASGDANALGDTMAATFLAHPRCCALMAILSSTLEQNVSEDTIGHLKMFMNGQSRRIVAALQAKMPSASAEDCAWTIAMTGSLLAGMWPAAHPTPAAQTVLARPEYAHMRLDMTRDLSRAIRVLLNSIA